MAILLILIIYIECYLIGISLLYILKKKINMIKAIVIGYISITALFQLIATPFMMYQSKFSYLYNTFSGIMLIITILSAYIVFKNFKKCNIFPINNINKFQIIVILLIAIQVILVVVLQHSDADDSAYITMSTTILERNRIQDCDYSTGIVKLPFSPTYRLVGYETFIAYLSKLGNIHVALFAHTLLPIFLIPLHYFISYLIVKELNSKYMWEIVLLTECIINIFSGYSAHSQGAFLLFRMWQGKASIANIVLPLLLLAFIKIARKNAVYLEHIIFLTCILVLGFHASSVGIYLIPFSYACYTIIVLIKNKNLKVFFRLCIPVLLVLPFVLIKFILLLNSTEYLQTIISEKINYFSIVKLINGQSSIILIYIVCVIYLLIKGNNQEKWLLSGYGIVVFATFLNPFLINLVSKITGSPVYWRIFWILQMNYAICFATLKLSQAKKSRNLNRIAFLICIYFLILNGKFIFNSNNFKISSNWYKLDKRALIISDALLNDEKNEIMLLAPVELTYDIRQYNAKIKLAWSRYTADSYNLAGKTEEFWDLYNHIYMPLYIDDNYIDDFNNIIYLKLKQFKINYIILEKEKEFNYNNKLIEVKKLDEYILYKVKSY